MAQPFNSASLELTGEAFPVAEQVRSFSASVNGALAYHSGNVAGGLQLEWFDRSGKSQGTVGTPGLYNDVALSPDGNRPGGTR